MHFLKTFVFEDKRLSWFWLLVRVYVGWQWLHAGYEKLINPIWIGDKAGVALTGFINGALAKTTGPHPDVSGWYAWFLENSVLPNVDVWSYFVTYGEILVGLGLIVGAFTFIAAFFGFFMNFNFLLSGAVSINPQLLVLSMLIMLAHRSASYWGLDYYIHRAEKSWALFRHI